MPTSYRTPGVYVEEITKFPPSVAAVETAIPAFIGYTERAQEKIADDLHRVPKRITAIAEYTTYFGSPEPEENFAAVIEDRVDPNTGRLIRTVNVPEPAAGDKSPYLMAYAIQMYFANGGGPCYIISVGSYEDDIDADALGNNPTGRGGLDLLEKEDEPTLIVFPDAQSLNDGDFYGLYQAALAQCNKLKDRFAVMDTKGTEVSANTLFRNGIGTNYLKYGAVYFPFIETTLGYSYSEEAVRIAHTPSDIFNVPGLTADVRTQIVDTIDELTGDGFDTADADAVTDANGAEDKIAALEDFRDWVNDTILSALNNNIQVHVDAFLDGAEAFNVNFDDPEIQQAIDNLQGKLDTLSEQQLRLDTIVAESDAFLAIPEEERGAVDPATVDALITADPAGFTVVFEAITEALSDAPTLVELITALETQLTANDPDVFIPAVAESVEEAQAQRLVILTIDPTVEGDLAANLTNVSNALSAMQTAIAAIIENAKDIANVPVLNSTLADTIGNIDLSILSNSEVGNLGLIEQIAALSGEEPSAQVTAAFVALYNQTLVPFLNNTYDALVKIQQGVTYFDVDGLTLAAIENIDNASYNTIKREIESIGVKLPPSSTMVGIYAQVDRDRGVWKAPANVSLTNVTKPLVKITNDIQDGLNIDPVAGKSINAIRAFAGKGTLVWGARTLAGNDNEWRYIPVRRFFNFVEESVKKATEQFVFEPNDANTWVRVRAMIENFLILQWRAGALQGAKPEKAFYVRVGLGETMTAVDILEGRMIVEIGMAVVRPAEFIILRFAHLLAEA